MPPVQLLDSTVKVCYSYNSTENKALIKEFGDEKPDSADDDGVGNFF